MPGQVEDGKSKIKGAEVVGTEKITDPFERRERFFADLEKELETIPRGVSKSDLFSFVVENSPQDGLDFYKMFEIQQANLPNYFVEKTFVIKHPSFSKSLIDELNRKISSWRRANGLVLDKSAQQRVEKFERQLDKSFKIYESLRDLGAQTVPQTVTELRNIERFQKLLELRSLQDDESKKVFGILEKIKAYYGPFLQQREFVRDSRQGTLSTDDDSEEVKTREGKTRRVFKGSKLARDFLGNYLDASKGKYYAGSICEMIKKSEIKRIEGNTDLMEHVKTNYEEYYKKGKIHYGDGNWDNFLKGVKSGKISDRDFVVMMAECNLSPGDGSDFRKAIQTLASGSSFLDERDAICLLRFFNFDLRDAKTARQLREARFLLEKHFDLPLRQVARSKLIREIEDEIGPDKKVVKNDETGEYEIVDAKVGEKTKGKEKTKKKEVDPHDFFADPDLHKNFEDGLRIGLNIFIDKKTGDRISIPDLPGQKQIFLNGQAFDIPDTFSLDISTLSNIAFLSEDGGKKRFCAFSNGNLSIFSFDESLSRLEVSNLSFFLSFPKGKINYCFFGEVNGKIVFGMPPFADSDMFACDGKKLTSVNIRGGHFISGVEFNEKILVNKAVVGDKIYFLNDKDGKIYWTDGQCPITPDTIDYKGKVKAIKAQNGKLLVIANNNYGENKLFVNGVPQSTKVSGGELDDFYYDESQDVCYAVANGKTMIRYRNSVVFTGDSVSLRFEGRTKICGQIDGSPIFISGKKDGNIKTFGGTAVISRKKSEKIEIFNHTMGTLLSLEVKPDEELVDFDCVIGEQKITIYCKTKDIKSGQLINHAVTRDISNLDLKSNTGLKQNQTAQQSIEVQHKMALLSLVENPDVKAIEKYSSLFGYDFSTGSFGHKPNGSVLNQRNVDVLNRAIKHDPRIVMNTISAQQDVVSPEIVERTLYTLFPELLEAQRKLEVESYKEPLAHKLKRKRELEKNGSLAQRGDVLRVVDEKSIVGADLKAGSKKEKEKEIFSPAGEGGFFAKNYYYDFDQEKKVWRVLPFETEPHLAEPVEEATHFIPVHESMSQVQLLTRPGGQIIEERVKLVVEGKKGKKEYQNAVVEKDEMGRYKVNVHILGLKVIGISYTERISMLPPILNQVSEKDYKKFKQRFLKKVQREKIEKLAVLPPIIKQFLDTIIELPPEERVKKIQNFVREHGYYDFDNGELQGRRKEQSLSERFASMIGRMDGIKEKKKLSGQYKLAGVCADFAELTVAMLREVEIVSGVAVGYDVRKGEKATKETSHATAYVLWPGEKKGNKIVLVDATPGAGGDRLGEKNEEVKELSLPSLVEGEKKAVEVKKEVVEIAKQGLQALRDGDLREMSNGELERTLNIVLQVEAKKIHIEKLREIVNLMLYTPFKHRLFKFLDENDPEFTAEFLSNLTDHPILKSEKEEKSFSVAGKEYMDFIRASVDSLAQIPIVGGHSKAYKLFKKVIIKSQGILSQEEVDLAVGVIRYLSGEAR